MAPSPLAALGGVVLLAMSALPVAAEEAPVAAADMCLEFAAGSLDEAVWADVRAALGDVVASRSALFPEPVITLAPPLRIDVASGHAGLATSTAGCLEPGSEWTAYFGRGFLQAGAERMLAEAPTTPGIDSEVSIEWHPDETRLRTTLVFAGPLDIPNGTCWVDDRLSIDAEGGIVLASGEQGVETSPFAEGACGRFFDHLPNGGAGEQAVTMLPSSIKLGDGSQLHLLAESVIVSSDAVIVAGSLQRD